MQQSSRLSSVVILVVVPVLFPYLHALRGSRSVLPHNTNLLPAHGIVQNGRGCVTGEKSKSQNVKRTGK
eukprot:3942003-Pleurochrysis_carterae.AAC.1